MSSVETRVYLTYLGSSFLACRLVATSSFVVSLEPFVAGSLRQNSLRRNYPLLLNVTIAVAFALLVPMLPFLIHSDARIQPYPYHPSRHPFLHHRHR